MIATIAYEVFLFGYLFNGEKGPFAFSVFFAYVFSLSGAIPLALILAWIGGKDVKFKAFVDLYLSTLHIYSML